MTGVLAAAPAVIVANNITSRTPGIASCPNDGTDVYSGIVATSAAANTPARVQDNKAIMNVGTAPGGTCTSGYLCYVGFATNGYATFSNNEATDLNTVPFFAAFGPLPETFDGLQINGTRLVNMGYAIALGGHGRSGILVSDNVDLSGTIITRGQGDYILARYYMGADDVIWNSCKASTVTNQLHASDSNVNTWGSVLASGGSNYVTAQCRYSGSSYDYTVTGK